MKRYLWNYDICNSIKQIIVDDGVPSLEHRKHLLGCPESKVGIRIAKGKVGRWLSYYVVIITKDARWQEMLDKIGFPE